MVIAIVPMPMIIFYAHLQQASADYKEMMAAVIAILMSLYHVIRTAWGLIQLASFSKWCFRLVQRMHRSDMIMDISICDFLEEEMEELGGFQEFLKTSTKVLQGGRICVKSGIPADIESDITSIQDDGEETENWTHVISDVRKVLRVNNAVVDNELGGTDITVTIGRDGSLSINEKELCVARWCGAFLSSFGEYWSGQLHIPIDLEELFHSCSQTLGCLKMVTFPVNGNKIRFHAIDWKDGGPYNSSMEFDGFGKIPDWLRHRKPELENLIGGFPGLERQRSRRPDTILVHALLIAQCMDEPMFNSLIDYNLKFTVRDPENGWFLLLWQHGKLPRDEESPLMHPDCVPPFPWGKLMVPLWDKCTNWRILQASVHVDNIVYLDTPHVSQDAGEPRCWFKYTWRRYRDEFEYKSGVLYSGTVLESVRTFLAYWISYRTPKFNETDWRPSLPTGKFRFSTDTDPMMFGVWECQSTLRERIADMGVDQENLPICIELILLFILALPRYEGSDESSSEANNSQDPDSPAPEVAENDPLFSVIYEPLLSPQDIKVRIQVFKVDGAEDNNVIIDLISGEPVTAFHWEKWVNSVMGYLKAMDDASSEKETEDSAVRWRKRTPTKVDLSRPLVTVSNTHLSNLRGDIQVWTGWPFFDIKIAQFEMNEWLRASGCLKGYCERLESNYYDFRNEVKNEHF